MAQLLVETNDTTFSVKHRGICDTNSYHWKGPWRVDYTAAERDAVKHSVDHGHYNIWVQTKQLVLAKKKIEL